MRENIRQWMLEDLPSVQHVAWLTWLDAYSSFIPEADLRSYFDEHYTLEALQTLFHASGVGGFVVEIDAKVVAYVKTQYNAEEERFYVSSLYVLPAFQGLGLGTKLMMAAEQDAARYNIDQVWLGVMTQNRAALEWYRAMGFQFVEEKPFTMGNTTVPHLIGFKMIGRGVPHAQ